MPVKKTTKRAKKTAKKAAAKKAPAKKKTAKVKKGQAYECGICGYRIIVDEVCGCTEEHLFICCDKAMKRKRARKAA
jgi:hypothetical protein